MNKYLLLSLLFVQSAFSADKAAHAASKLGNPRFVDLARTAQLYVHRNQHRLALEKNESGFLRIAVPISDEQRTQMGNDLRKCRLNFWAPQSGVEISPESIHSHPNYFESLVINGGYTHELFGASKDRADEHELYTIYKDGPKKSMVYNGRDAVKKTGEQTFTRGSLITFPGTMIHRVKTTKPSTLTLNAVFGNEDAPSSYSVWLSRNGTLADVKTKREVLLPSEARPYVDEVQQHLHDFLKTHDKK